jgi:hypothetical protein
VTGRLIGVTRPAPAPIAWSVAQLALATPGLRTETRDLAASVVHEHEHRAPRVPRQRRRRVRRQLLRWLTNPR